MATICLPLARMFLEEEKYPLHGPRSSRRRPAQPRSVIPFVLSSHSHNVEVLAWNGLPEIVCGAWGVDSVMSRTMQNDEVNPETSCMGVSHVYSFFEIEVVSANEILFTLRKQSGEPVASDDGVQPIPSDRISQFSVFLDRPFECP